MKSNLMEVDSIDGVYWIQSLEEPETIDYVIFYWQKNKEKEWSFKINLN